MLYPPAPSHQHQLRLTLKPLLILLPVLAAVLALRRNSHATTTAATLALAGGIRCCHAGGQLLLKVLHILCGWCWRCAHAWTFCRGLPTG